MKATHLLLWFACLLIAAVELAGCADHLSPGSFPARLRVKSLTQVVPPNPTSGTTTSTTTVSAFSYDLQGRLAGINTYQTPDNMAGPVENGVFEYDAQNRLIQFRRDIVTRNSAQPTISETYQYSYNAAGQVSSFVNSNSGSITLFTVTLGYNGSGQLATSSRIFNISPVSYSQSNVYTFTGSNLTQLNTTTNLTFQQTVFPTTNFATTYTHDNKVNPFYGVKVIPAPFTSGLANAFGGNFNQYIYYGGFDNVFNLSRNNVLSSTTPSLLTTYTFIYNSADLPISRVTTTTNLPSNVTRTTETLLYEYESY